MIRRFIVARDAKVRHFREQSFTQYGKLFTRKGKVIGVATFL